MPATRNTALALPAVLACLTIAPADAQAAPSVPGAQAGRPAQIARQTEAGHKSAARCNVNDPVIGGIESTIANGICAGEALVGTIAALPGEAAQAVGSSVLDAVATWMIGAATQVTTFVAKEMQQSTTPQLQSAWFQAQFTTMADLGAALALLVALVAFASAAVRRDPQALAGTLAGIARAGIGTGVVVALTVLGLEVADQVSGAVLSGSPHTFWATVAHAWGTKQFGGFGSSALATMIAAVEVLAAIGVCLELIVRDAAIFPAVMFFPVVLAASIWPVLASWTGRLARLLLLFVVLKPVALIVLSLAGNAAAAGLSGASGVPGSVGTILTAVVIFVLAALAPWALMFLLAADAESAYMAAGLRSATAGAVAGGGRSLRNAGGLRSPGGGTRSPRGGGASSSGGQPGGGSPPSGGGSSPSGGAPGGGASAQLSTSSLGSQTAGGGSIGAAAGASATGHPSSPPAERPSRPGRAHLRLVPDEPKGGGQPDSEPENPGPDRPEAA